VTPTFALSYGTPFFGADPDRLVTVARHAEQCGFDAPYVPEHFAIYPGAQLGEAAAVGVDYSTRGRRADEAIDVLRRLWAEDESGATFHGEFFEFENVFSFPKRVAQDGLPIHIGGSSVLS
jgi:alkanesulfonate monooxygenase SsuD/methylene tetrahydromethanopterin reductase-like flavin-dependent oxidoreductase (luciferase family)